MAPGIQPQAPNHQRTSTTGITDPHATAKPTIDVSSQPSVLPVPADDLMQLTRLVLRLQSKWNEIDTKYHRYLWAKRSPKTYLEYIDRYIRHADRFGETELPRTAGVCRSKVFIGGMHAYRTIIDEHVDLRRYGKMRGWSKDQIHEAIELLPDVENCLAGLVANWEAGPSLPRKPRRRFGKELAHLQGEPWCDWETAFCNAARTKTTWFLPICTMLSVGVRPADLSLEPRGHDQRPYPVVVRRPAPGQLEFEIFGAKQENDLRAGDPGVGKRWITVVDDAPWTNALSAALGEEPALVIRPGSLHQVSNIVSSIGYRLFGPTPRLSAHFLRHRFATCLRRWGLTPMQCAIAMGHGSLATFHDYGLARDVPIEISLKGKIIALRAERPPGAARFRDM